MNIKHHLDDATLMSYAASALPHAMALVVACHISMCPQCTARVKQHEAIGGALLDELEPAALSDGSLQSVLEAIEQGNSSLTSRQSAQRAVPSASELPVPLQDYLETTLDEVPWKTIVPGVAYFDLPTQPKRGGVSRLLKIAPGKSLLEHSHNGSELTLILRGSFCDEMGHFGVGDIADLDGEITHQPLVDSTEACICLIATEAPLKFNSLLGKLVQPITGF